METWQIICSMLAAVGVPSAIVGIIAKRIEKRIDIRMAARAKEREEAEKAKEEMLCQLVRATWASIALGEATARAVQRIPDAHCNGDMHSALEYAKQVKHEQKDLLAKQGIHALW